MAHVTARRLEKVRPILDMCNESLTKNKRFDTHSLESNLKETLDTGYMGVKTFVQDLVKNEDYRLISLYYMERSNVPGVASEFKSILAKAYGIENYDSAEREPAQKLFWDQAFAA